MLSYNPHDWYWAASDGRIFSSARSAMVSEDDADFRAWVERGGVASPWPRDEAGIESDVELQAVLTPYGVFLTDVEGLQSYAAARRYDLETGGIEIAGSHVATDRGSQALINGAFNLVQVAPTTVIKFKTQAGFVDLDAAAIQIISTAVGQHVQACFAKEAEVVAAITAKKPTIATRAQVDAAFATLSA
jgi:hypothetical protein